MKPTRGFKHLPSNKQHIDRKKEDKAQHKAVLCEEFHCRECLAMEECMEQGMACIQEEE